MSSEVLVKEDFHKKSFLWGEGEVRADNKQLEVKTRQVRKSEEWKNCGNPTRGKNGRMRNKENGKTFILGFPRYS